MKYHLFRFTSSMTMSPHNVDQQLQNCIEEYKIGQQKIVDLLKANRSCQLRSVSGSVVYSTAFFF
jgi:hypothetical protein